MIEEVWKRRRRLRLLLPFVLVVVLIAAVTPPPPPPLVFVSCVPVVEVPVENDDGRGDDGGGGGRVKVDRDSTTTTTERHSETSSSNNADGSDRQPPPKQQECIVNPMGGQQCISHNINDQGEDTDAFAAAAGGGNVRTTSQTTTTTTTPDEDDDDKIWTVGTVDEIHEYLNCSKMNDGYSYIHTNESWIALNDLYNNLMTTKNKSSSSSVNAANANTAGFPPKFVQTGFQYPIEIRYDPARGRGIFLREEEDEEEDEESSSSSSSKVIKKGSLVWKGVNTASFDDPQDFRDFVRSLTTTTFVPPSSSSSSSSSTTFSRSSTDPNTIPSIRKNNNNNQHQQHYHPHQLACDVLIWAYTRLVSDEDDDEYLVCVDLDEGSMVNSASWSGNTTTNNNNSNNNNVDGDRNGDDDDHHPSNDAKDDAANCALGFDDGPMPDNPTEQDYERIWYGCYMYFYATKDIYPGTEIIADYNEFSEQAYDEMGL